MFGQPKIAEVKYLSDISLDSIAAEATKLIQEDWELFGDVKFINNAYVQTLVRIEFPETKE